MKKFSPPHSADKIDAVKLRIADCKRGWDSAQAEFDKMLQENHEAEQAEEVCKAKIMTPTMLHALERLERGWRILIGGVCRLRDELGGFWAFDKRLFERLHIAGYIGKTGGTWTTATYGITTEGRAALSAAKKTKGSK